MGADLLWPEPALMLGDEQRRKAAVAVAGHVDTDGPILGHDRLGPFTIALAVRSSGFGRASGYPR